MDPVVARKTWRTIEPVHAMIDFAPEGREAYAAATVLRDSRAWPQDECDAALERLARRGLVEPGDELQLTHAGRVNRSSVEERTDALALVAYVRLGDDGCRRLREIGRLLSRAVIGAGLLIPDPSGW
jgi:hypothetical protein